MREGLTSIKEMLEALVAVKEGGGESAMDKLNKILSQKSQKKDTPTLTLRTEPSQASGGGPDDPPVSYNESRVLALFPINKYTKAINWLLKQESVRELIKNQMMYKIYAEPRLFKPDSEFVVKKYLDFLLSSRVQTHMGKATGGGRNLDFSRCPLPMPVLNIADEKLGRLSKNRPPGARDNAEFLKSRCNDARTLKVHNSEWILESSCQEEMAIRIFFERIDFYENHMVRMQQSVIMCSIN